MSIKLQKQHDRYERDSADCHRTAIACLLGIDKEEIPLCPGNSWKSTDAEKEWLKQRNLAPLYFHVIANSKEEALAWIGARNPNHYYLFFGESANHRDHVVICKGSEEIWDPSLDNSGIIGPMIETQTFEFEFLVPSFLEG